LPAAGSLVLLLALVHHSTREGTREGTREDEQRATSRFTPDKTAAQMRAWGAFHSWVAAVRMARQHPRDQPASRQEARPKLDHLSDLERTPAEGQLLWIVEEDLVSACMRERGFTYVPEPPDDGSGSDLEHARVNRGDVDAARAEGYGLFKAMLEGEAPAGGVARTAEATVRTTDEEHSAFLEALQGPATSPADPSVQHLVEHVPLPDGGEAYWYRDSCLAQARRQLYGEDYEHNELGYTQAALEDELATLADEDPEYKNSLDAWRNCMRARGYDEAQPASAADRLEQAYDEGNLSLDELHAQEVPIATTDAECYTQAGLERARQAAEARAEQVLLENNREELMAMKQVRDEALERAESLAVEHAL
jgi:hypothetical protein